MEMITYTRAIIIHTRGSTSIPSFVEYCLKLLIKFATDESQFAPEDILIESIEDLQRAIYQLRVRSSTGRGPEDLVKILDEIKIKLSEKEAPKEPRLTKEKELKDNDSRVGMMMMLLEDWVRLSTDPSANNDKTRLAFISQMQQQGIFASDDLNTLFFRTGIEKSIADYFTNINSPHCYKTIDAFSNLAVLLIKTQAENLTLSSTGNSSGPSSNLSPPIKLTLLNRLLFVIVIVMTNGYTHSGTHFPQKPFFRLFINLLFELNVPDKNLDQVHSKIVLTLGECLQTINPLRLPVFSFAWVEIISHRLLMPKLLLLKQNIGWPLLHQLLVSLFQFLFPFLSHTNPNDPQHVQLTEPIRVLYKGTLRVLLVLLHDFPEFLCDYHLSLCDVIPPSCIQLRNLILSAFPRNMRLPDPFTPNLKVDLLPEINHPPRILSNYVKILQTNNLKNSLDNYLKTRGPVSFLLDLRSKLVIQPNDITSPSFGSSKYNVSLLNSLVVYVGVQAINQLQLKGTSSSSPVGGLGMGIGSSGSVGGSPLTHSAPMDIFQQLIVDLDNEGRYHFVNGIVNQLRYPNSHTHYFSCVLLYLFAEANQPIIHEQITRVLLERLIVNRPHPWGLLITFIELIKNPRYNFWQHPFTKCAPEIERLFESVARSCMVTNKQQQPQQNMIPSQTTQDIS